jgi:hypothetical protein
MKNMQIASNRALARIGAREVTPMEIEHANNNEAVKRNTEFITTNPLTGQLDGDGILH